MNDVVLISVLQNLTVLIGFMLFSLFLLHYYYLGQGVSLIVKVKKSLIMLAVFYVIGIANGYVAQFMGINFLGSIYEWFLSLF